MIFAATAVSQLSSDDKKEEPVEINFIEPPKEVEIIPEEIIPPRVFPVGKGCSGDARCIEGFVTRIIDGDTIEVDGQSIRFALVDTPEYGDYDYTQARSYMATICPLGSSVLVDEDDLQTGGSYGRMIGVIYCNNLNLNEEILEVG
ncbi:MAG: thermonuclease family protein, partial [Nitrosopumilus sp.]|nr:thermonuclease family protein [Nitrosopumilus sp.]